MKKIFSVLFALSLCLGASAQTLRGEVVDALTGEPLISVHVSLVGEEDRQTITDMDGRFIFENLPIKRYNVQATYVGYTPMIVSDQYVSSGKETVVRIEMSESIDELGEVVIKPQVKKEMPINQMMVVGGKMLSVEESSRFAGGFDDPARMVGSFAGIASTGAQNGISVHGMAPHYVKWHIEGVEVVSPSHMGDAYNLGEGVISALSSQVTGNSDFAYSAFPAEYGNALSGLLDMQLRNGNNQKYEHSFGAGLLGLEAQSEGPIGKNGASYVFNYRYSLLGLAADMGINTDGNIMKYQDLNYVINIPTKKAGVFKLFGTAWNDHAYYELEDPDQWNNSQDAVNIDVKQTAGTFGISNRLLFKNKGTLKTTFAVTRQDTKTYDESVLPVLKADEEYTYLGDYVKNWKNRDWRHDITARFKRNLTDLTFSSVYQQRIGKKTLFKSGVSLINHDYDMSYRMAPEIVAGVKEEDFVKVANAEYKFLLANAFASASVNLSSKAMLNFGAFVLWNTDNGKVAVDPRVSMRFSLTENDNLSFGYGLQSMMERIEALAYTRQMDWNLYYLPNKNLDFTRSHQFMFSYDHKFGESYSFKADLFYQQLFDVAVGTGVGNEHFSMLNLHQIFIDTPLENKGKGRNYGIDLSLEKYFTNGYYWMLSGTVFKSEYANADGKWHDQFWNRGWMAKGLIGKEWFLGKNKSHVLNVSGKATVMGGLRYTPLVSNWRELAAANPLVYDEEALCDWSRPFESQLDPEINLDLTITYRINRKNLSHEVGLKWLNILMTGSYIGQYYNYNKDKFEAAYTAYTFPNLYYRVYF